MSLSDVVENEMCQDFLIRHPVLWLALSRANPGETGSTIDEPSAVDGYVRQLIGGVTVSGNQILINDGMQFPVATGNQGTLTYGAVFSAESGGTFLGYGVITATPCPVNTVVVIPALTPILTMD